MQTTPLTPQPQSFRHIVGNAVRRLKQQLQHDYEQAYPELREVIHLVLDQEETRARDLTLFPHLLLPDLVEEHVSKLNLRPVDTKHEDVFAPRSGREFDGNASPFGHPIFALA